MRESKPLVDIDGAFIIESPEDITESGLFVTKKFVENGRARTTKVYVTKTDIHAELVKALGLTFEEDLRTPEEWCRELNAVIIDPDGWRGDPSRNWHDRISRQEFDRRLRRCTIDSSKYPLFHAIPSPAQPKNSLHDWHNRENG